MKPSSCEGLAAESFFQERSRGKEPYDEPFIRIIEQREKALFKAVFSVELAGVARELRSHENQSSQDSGKLPYSLQSALISSLSQNQSLDFVYRGRRDAIEKPFFSWKIEAGSSGETRNEATETARRLLQDLRVMFSAMSPAYRFSPVREEAELSGDKGRKALRGLIRPMGIAIPVGKTMPVGFRYGAASEDAPSRVIIAPCKDTLGDSCLRYTPAATLTCPGEVDISLLVTPRALEGKDLQVIASALQWLKNGEVKQVAFNSFAKEGIEDEELLKRIMKNLEAWLRSPYGYDITCTVRSEETVPRSFLSLVPLSFSMVLFRSPCWMVVNPSQTSNLGTLALI